MEDKAMRKRKIDDIFKEGLENPDMPFNENHWVELEERLNERNSRSRHLLSNWWKWGAAAAIIAVLFLLGREFVAPVSENKASENLTESRVNQHKPEHNQVNEDPAAPFKNKDTIAVSRKQAAENTQPAINLAENNIGTKIKPAPDQDISAFYSGNHSAKLKELDMVGLSKTGISEESLKMLNVVLSIPGNSLLENRTSADSVGHSAESIALPGATKRGVLSILVAPDLTSVKGSGKNSLSANAGLIYTHPVYNKISVSTGLIYSRKNYSSAYSFYKPEKALPPGYYPTNVAAVCDILSIPVLVNLELVRTKNKTITLSAGASSYFMLRENYTFSYSDQEDRVYEIRNQNKHYLGVADLAITFQQRISDKLSIGVRPFYQIPLTGIGYGRTSLQSKGLALTFGVGL
jgi:hypothetical protein